MKRMAFALMFVLAACASRIAETPEQRVYAAQADYNGLLAAAVAYETQPRCSDTQPAPCSDPGVVAEIRRADVDAWTLLLRAQEYVRSDALDGPTINAAIVAAHSAIDAFRAIMANHGILGASVIGNGIVQAPRYHDAEVLLMRLQLQ